MKLNNNSNMPLNSQILEKKIHDVFVTYSLRVDPRKRRERKIPTQNETQSIEMQFKIALQ